jgi:hypothetical protein
VLGYRAEPTVRGRLNTLINLCDNVILSLNDEYSVDLENLSKGKVNPVTGPGGPIG